MKFRVDGVFNGRPPESFVIDADSIVDARRLAETSGITVLEVFPEGVDAPPLVPQDRLSRSANPGRIEVLLLTFGQAVSALGCVATPVYALVALSQAVATRERLRDAQGPTIWIIGGAIIGGAVIGFLYSAAMLVVFTRCKRIPTT